MSDHEVLLDVLRRFARSMTHRYDVIDVLYELCDHVVQVLDATGAGVCLFGEDDILRFVTATSEAVVAAEKAQEALQDGPCYSSILLDRPVPVADLRQETDWPGYRERVDGLGFNAVLGLPLSIDGERLGSLDVYDDEPREWSPEATQAGLVLADIAAAYLVNAGELARTRRTAEQLTTALDSRVTIEQAKGRLSGDLGISVDEAFAALRTNARQRNLPLKELAARIVEEGATVLENPTS